MRFAAITTISFIALAACSPKIPDSAAGVGEAPVMASSSGAALLPSAAPVSAAPLGEGAAIAAETTAALGLAPAAPLAGAPAPTDLAPMSALAPTAAAIPGAVAPAAAPAAEIALTPGSVAPTAAISDEQDFEAVASRETIESDAMRIEANRAQYVVIQPTDLPPRPDGSGPSIVAYALATTNSPGQALYSRVGLAAQARFDSACAKYGSSDAAQEAFLDAGGPERDRYGMDPDGDGFACFWDPRPFRAARGGAPEVVTTYEVVETPGEG